MIIPSVTEINFTNFKIIVKVPLLETKNLTLI